MKIRKICEKNDKQNDMQIKRKGKKIVWNEMVCGKMWCRKSGLQKAFILTYHQRPVNHSLYTEKQLRAIAIKWLVYILHAKFLKRMMRE